MELLPWPFLIEHAHLDLSLVEWSSYSQNYLTGIMAGDFTKLNFFLSHHDVMVVRF